MCPECYAVFMKAEKDTFVIGLHKPDCSQPKLETYEEPVDDVIKKLEIQKGIKSKWKTDGA